METAEMYLEMREKVDQLARQREQEAVLLTLLKAFKMVG